MTIAHWPEQEAPSVNRKWGKVNEPTLDVVAVSQPAELLLPSRVPHVEANLAASSVKHQRVDLNTERS